MTADIKLAFDLLMFYIHGSSELIQSTFITKKSSMLEFLKGKSPSEIPAVTEDFSWSFIQTQLFPAAWK